MPTSDERGDEYERANEERRGVTRRRPYGVGLIVDWSHTLAESNRYASRPRERRRFRMGQYP
jgi:hypothetical protein